MHSKAVKRSEKKQRERQADMTKLKSEKKARPLGNDVWSTLNQKDPIRAPSLPLALSEEFSKGGTAGGGLRTVFPEG